MPSTDPNAVPTFEAERLRPSASLLAAQIALGAAIDRCAVDGLGIDPTITDLLVRLELAPQGQLRAVEICRQLLLSPSHISRVIDRAERTGLVERRPDPDDRRAILVVPTNEGRQLVARFLPRLDAVLDRTVYAVLDADEIELLTSLLDRVERAARDCTTDDQQFGSD